MSITNITMSGSRSIAAARTRRAGEQAKIVSGGRPITSIASQSAFANQPYAQHQQQQNRGGRGVQQQQQQPQKQPQKPSNGLPFTKLTVPVALFDAFTCSDAVNVIGYVPNFNIEGKVPV